MIDRIIEGKRRKLLGMNTKKRNIKEENVKVEGITTPETELDRETILTNELEKSTATSNPPLLVQTFTSKFILPVVTISCGTICCRLFKTNIYIFFFAKG